MVMNYLKFKEISLCRVLKSSLANGV